MEDKLRELRITRHIAAKEMVEVVKVLYPKYDKIMQSKCERGGEYGIELRPDAMEALVSKFSGEPPQPLSVKRKDTHRLSCRISCRLADDEYELLQQLVSADGYGSMQDWISHQVQLYLAAADLKKTRS